MTFESKMGIGSACEIFLEVVCQRGECVLLTLNQSHCWPPRRRLRCREIDAANGQPSFYRGRRGQFEAEFSLTIRRTAAYVVHPSRHRVAYRAHTSGVQLDFGARSDDLAPVRLQRESERNVVGIAGSCGDVYAVPRMNRGWTCGATHRRRTIGPRIYSDIRRATRSAPAAIIHSRRDRVSAQAHTCGVPTDLPSCAINAAS